MNNLSGIKDTDFYPGQSKQQFFVKHNSLCGCPECINETMGALPEFFKNKKNLIYAGIGAILLFFLFKGKSFKFLKNPAPVKVGAYRQRILNLYKNKNIDVKLLGLIFNCNEQRIKDIILFEGLDFRNKSTKQLKSTALYFIRKGFSTNEVSRKLNIPYITIVRWIKRMEKEKQL